MGEWADGLDRSTAIDEKHSDFFGFATINPVDLLSELKSHWAQVLGRMDILDYWRWANTWCFHTECGFRILIYAFAMSSRFAPGYAPGISFALLVTPFPDEGKEKQPYNSWAFNNYKQQLYDVVSRFGGQRLPIDLVLSQHYTTADLRRYTDDDFDIS
jgi:hypothetical protein